MELNELTLSINQVGYQDDNIGTLIIGNEDEKIESVVKLPIKELEKLISEIKTVANNV